MNRLKLGGVLVISMPVDKKIIVDGNVENLIPALKEKKVSKIFDISQLNLPPNAPDNLIAKKLNEFSKLTPNSAFLFITNNAAQFDKLGTKNYDILLVPKTINRLIVNTIKIWLSILPKSAQGLVYSMRCVRNAKNMRYDIFIIKQFKNDRPTTVKE